MTLPKLFTRKKFRGIRFKRTRRPLRASAQARYEEMDEPNMKLSRALLIVLLLHVVAVSGIIAFNAIKTRQNSTLSAAPVSSPARPSEAVPGRTRPTSEPPAVNTPTAEIKRARPVGDPAHGSQKTYVVAKGDNPVTIAKKFKVSYDELLALNHIDDPRKLQIGQKLLIPAKAKKSKKTEE